MATSCQMMNLRLAFRNRISKKQAQLVAAASMKSEKSYSVARPSHHSRHSPAAFSVSITLSQEHIITKTTLRRLPCRNQKNIQESINKLLAGFNTE